MTHHFFIQLSLVCATSMVAAAALADSDNWQTAVAPTGLAMTAESGGQAKGCVSYTTSWVEPRPGKRPDRKLLFDMRNQCEQPVWIRLAYQTGLSASPGGNRLLKPGERLAGEGGSDNYIFVDPTTPFLRYWLWQHATRPAQQPSFHNCHLKVRDPGKPPCPAGAVTVFGEAR